MKKTYCDVCGIEIKRMEKTYFIKIDTIQEYKGVDKDPAMPTKECCPECFLKIKDIITGLCCDK